MLKHRSLSDGRVGRQAHPRESPGAEPDVRGCAGPTNRLLCSALCPAFRLRQEEPLMPWAVADWRAAPAAGVEVTATAAALGSAPRTEPPSASWTGEELTFCSPIRPGTEGTAADADFVSRRS